LFIKFFKFIKFNKEQKGRSSTSVSVGSFLIVTGFGDGSLLPRPERFVTYVLCPVSLSTDSIPIPIPTPTPMVFRR